MPRQKEWSHLIKPLVIKQGPAGLYGEPRFWAEGKDWEGYAGNFSYGFFKGPAVCHPLEGAVSHPYDEVLIFAGIDTTSILNLGGEVSIELGEEREEHVFTKPTVVCIPKGMPHGPATIRRVTGKAIAHYLFGLAPEYKATVVPERSRPPKTSGHKYAHLVKLLRTYLSVEQRMAMAHVDVDKYYEKKPWLDSSKTGMGYEALSDDSGVVHPKDRMGPGNADQLVWLFGEDIQNFELNFTWGFFNSAGKWHRHGEGHTHPEEEALIYVGLNPDNLNYLGAEIEIAMGPDFERHFFNTPTCVVCPKGFIHLPCITRWVDDPYAFVVGCLSAVHDAPWVNPEDLE